jgi:hypothetical protein
MLGGKSGSTRSNEHHESVTPCRKIAGTPSARPCSTYSIRTPVESDMKFFTASSVPVVTSHGPGGPIVARDEALDAADVFVVPDLLEMLADD